MSKHQHRSSHSVGSPLMTIKNELLLGAVVRGELPTVRRLLDRHKADINSKNSNGLGCLQLAILNGHTKLAEFLIQKGVDIHMVDCEGHTALHDAALVENVVLVRKLISKGLSPLLTTDLKELVIDLAGSVQMEKLLCEEMYQAGEVKLARQYYYYLGLDRDEAEKTDNAGRPLVSRGIHPPPPRSHQKHQGGPTGCKSTLRAHASSSSSPKTEIKKSSGPQSNSQVSKNISTHASRVHPSAKIANSSENESAGKVSVSGRTNCQATELGSLPSNEPDSVGNHRNVLAEYKEQTPPPLSETASSETLSDSWIDSDESSGGSAQSSSSDLSAAGSSSSSLTQNQPNQELIKSQRELDPPATGCESPQSARNPSPKQARESAAIKTLQQHSSFQLQIGLSLQQQSEQFSTLEEEDFFAADEEEDQFSTSPRPATSKSSSNSSPGLANRRQRASSFRADWFLPNRPSIIRPRKTPRPLNKTVSFADLPMTRSKPMFVGQTSKGGSGSSTMGSEKVEKTPNRTAGSNQLSHSLSTNVLDRYISNYNPEREKPKSESSETDSLFDAGIRALSLKPRKSSIASPMRRHHSENLLTRRRSVTFQPEVILQEIITDGDVKAVSEILESGMIEDVNKMSPSGLTALHQSAIDGNIECAKKLVAKGANINCTDCENWTPLHAAVENGSVEFVRFLLASGAKTNLKNDNGETPYDIAKSRAIRKMLLNAMNGGSPDADEFSDGEYSGEEEEEYSHAETESDDDDLEGEGSGMFDSNGEKTTLKERLGLTHTSALNNTQSNSVTPSPDLDNVFGGTQIFQRQEHELTSSTSSYGSIFESEDRVKEMDKKFTGTTKTLNAESDTDKISESGISTMEGSSDCSHRSRVLSSEDETIALDVDLDPDSLDYEFQEACLYCDVDRVLKLVKCKHDIDINRVNKTSGVTALHHSVLEENFALVQHLVKDFNADLHVQDIDGWTPLHAASAVGSIQIAQFLLDRGAKPSSLNNSCEFPVDVAEDEAMEKLLKNAMLGYTSEKCLKR